jgi:heptosyltransferase-2
MPRALLLKFAAIGDVILTIPAAWELHKAGFAIDWVCGRAVLPILQLYPWVHAIPVNDAVILSGAPGARLREVVRLWRLLRGTSYDLVANLYYDRRYRLLDLPVRAPRKLHLSHLGRACRILPGRSYTAEFARILLDRPDGVCPAEVAPVPPPAMPASPLPETSARRVVLVPAGARNMLAEATLRRWPAENYLRLAERLLAQGDQVVLVGGPDDVWVQPLFAPLAGSADLVDMVGKTSLTATLGLLASADAVVTHDTGPLHLAGLTGASLLALFGPTDPHCFLPRRTGVVGFWGGEGFACRPCYDGRNFAPCAANDCMRQLTVDAVFDLLNAMLDERQSGTLSPPRILTPRSTVAPTPVLQISGLRSEVLH